MESFVSSFGVGFAKNSLSSLFPRVDVFPAEYISTLSALENGFSAFSYACDDLASISSRIAGFPPLTLRASMIPSLSVFVAPV